MTDESGFAALSAADRHRVDVACDEFESAWQGLTPPAVRDFTAGFTEPALSCLIQELIKVDVAYRQRVDQGAAAGSYREQFPQHVQLIDEALAATVYPDDTGGVAADAAGAVPTRLGPYRILEELGRGGMGVVYKARQQNLDRLVALKVFRPRLDASDQGRERFRRETAALARLKHPGIVPLYEAGQTDGVYFFSMEWVEGPNLRDRIADHPLLGREAAEVVAKLARIVQVAHAQGILHRDLKPANVLLGRDGEPRLTDFGLARLAWETTGLTQEGQRLGTPSYMAPEQVASERGAIGPATDVYALGVVLYCCLAGHPPFRAAIAEETYRQILEDDPPPLRGIDRDLGTICLKCLEKSPQNRYRSAQELADDLDCFLRGEPIVARPPGLLERGIRWTRRHKWQAVAASVAILAMALLAIGGYAVAEHESERLQRELAEERSQLLETLRVKYANERSQLALEAGNLEAVAGASHDAAWDRRYLAHAASNRPTAWAVLVEGHWGMIAAALSADGQRLVSADAAGVLAVWDLQKQRLLRRLAKGRDSEELRRGLHYFEDRSPDAQPEASWGDCFTSVCWLGKTAEVAALSMTGRVVVFDTESGQQRPLWAGPPGAGALAAAADGKRLLVGGTGGRLCLLAADGKLLAQKDAASAGVTVVQWLSSRGQWLAGSEDGQVRLLRDATLDEAAVAAVPGPVWGLDFSAVKDTLAVAGAAPEVAVFKVTADGQLQRSALLPVPDSGHRVKAVHCLRFSTDGTRLYGITDTGLMIAWDVGSQRSLWTKEAVLRDDRLTQIAKQWRGGELRRELPIPFRRWACAVLVTDQVRTLLTAGSDAAIKVWDVPLTTGRANRVWETRIGPQPRLAFSVTSPHVLWALDQAGDLWALDVQADRVLAHHHGAHAGGQVGLATAAGSDAVVTVGGDSQVKFWRLEKGRIAPAHGPQLRSEHPLMSVAISPDRHWIAALDVISRVLVWNADTGQLVYVNTVTGSATGKPLTGRLAFNPDGTRLAAFGSGQSGNVFVCRRDPDAFRKLPDQIAVAGQGGTALAWNPARPGALIIGDDIPRYNSRDFGDTESSTEFTYPAAASMPIDILATPDKRRIVFLEESGTILICDPRYQLQMLRLQSSIAPTSGLALDPAGRYLAVAGQNGAIELWDAGAVERSQPPAAKDESARWSSVNVLDRTSATVLTESRLARIDRRGRFCLVYIESLPGASRFEGAAYFVRDVGGRFARERIVPEDAEFSRRLHHDSLALWLNRDDEPMVLFRQRTADLGPYDGRLVLGKRQEAGAWSLQTIHRHGNLGFYPTLLPSPDGDRVTGVVHFCFDGSYLLHSQPSEGPEWGSQPITLQGDGMAAETCQDAQGRLHMVFQPNRFNCDPAPPVYVRFEAHTGEEIREVVLPAGAFRTAIDILPDGAPVVAWQETRQREGLDRFLLMRRREGQWIPHQEPPIQPRLRGQPFAISPQGHTHLLEWRSVSRELVLWCGVGDVWTSAVIARGIRESEPNWAVIRFDSRGEPVVAVGRLGERYGWLRLLRRKR